MSDRYSVSESEGWFSRLGNALGGALLGLFLFLASFVVLFWNEGRAVDTARRLAEAGGIVVSVPADTVNPGTDGKLVHVTGKATTDETLTDDRLGVSAPALRLVRTVEMYQWQERKETRERKQLGGGVKTETEYSYDKIWAGRPIDSSQFHSVATKGEKTHVNPAWPGEYESKNFEAKKITLGAFTLSPALVGQISASEPLPITDAAAEKLPEAARGQFKVAEGRFYKGAAPASPEIGDLRIAFSVVKPQTVSVIAEQAGDTFRAYQPRSASGTIQLLHEGDKSAAEMIQAEQAANTLLTWLLRLAGFIVMALGLFLVLNPLRVLGDVVPFVGNMVGLVLGVFALLTAAVLSLVTIAVSWIVHRPLLGVGLLVAAAALGVGAVYLARRSRAAPSSGTA